MEIISQLWESLVWQLVYILIWMLTGIWFGR